MLAPAPIPDLRGLVLDMDGVLWQGEQPLPGLRRLFEVMPQRGLRYVLATNNSSRSPEDYATKLARFGLHVPPRQILTSATVTGTRLKADHPAGARAFVLGGAGLRQAVRDAGLEIVEGADPQADVVVAGIDFDLSYPRLAAAALQIQRGARFVGSNGDRSYPAEPGLLPGAGAILAALEAATGRRPEIMGKPEAPIFSAALAALDLPAASVAMVGDRLDTDIEGAVRAGLRSILVLSGVTPADTQMEGASTPDLVLDGIHQLAELLAPVDEAAGRP